PQGGGRVRAGALSQPGGGHLGGGGAGDGVPCAREDDAEMTEFVHQTVLRRETAALLAAAPGKVILDGTLGGGGHAEALLEQGARVIGLDQDPAALRAASQRLSPFEE